MINPLSRDPLAVTSRVQAIRRELEDLLTDSKSAVRKLEDEISYLKKQQERYEAQGNQRMVDDLSIARRRAQSKLQDYEIAIRKIKQLLL